MNHGIVKEEENDYQGRERLELAKTPWCDVHLVGKIKTLLNNNDER